MIIKHIKKTMNFPFLLSYSGGLDSTFLFYQLLKIKKTQPKLKFRAIHIDHQLNKNSTQWSEHCKQVCKKHDIPIIVKKVLIKKNKIGIEASSRLERYKIIHETVLPQEVILTAHNLNDQCETFLLALKRGSGITGLSGIPYKSKLFNKNTIIRPLLNISRSRIKHWIIKNKIAWIEDHSNYDINYDRNFLRHNILPLFTKRWPSFINNCAKSAFILRQEKQIIDPILQKNLNKYLVSTSILNIIDFKTMKSEIRNSLLRIWIKLNNYIVPSYKIIQKIYYEIILSKPDSKAKIKINNYKIQRYRNNLYLIDIMPCIKNLIIMWYQPWNDLKLPNNLGYIIQNNNGTALPYPKKNTLINIRFQISGKTSMQGHAKRKLVKQIWKENGIAPWNRNNIPLLFYNNDLISALGVFITIPKKNCENKKTWKISWVQKLKK